MQIYSKNIKNIATQHTSIYKLYKNDTCIWEYYGLCKITFGQSTVFPYNFTYYINNEQITLTVNDNNIEDPIYFPDKIEQLLMNHNSIISVDMSNIDLKWVKCCTQLFADCNNIISIDLSNVNFASNESCYLMFRECHRLNEIKGLENIVTSACKSLNSMFYAAILKGEINVSNWDTSNVTDMHKCFAMSRSNNVFVDTIYNNGRGEITYIKGLENWDTSNCETFESLFDNQCKMQSYNIANWNTSKVKNMAHMFRWNHINLTEIDLSGWDTSNCEDMNCMFRNCYHLEKIKFNFDMIKVADLTDIFLNDYRLTTLEGSLKNINVDLDTSVCPLTHNSAMIILNGLANVTNKKTLKLNSNTYATLSQTEISNATNKNWDVVSVVYKKPSNI